VKKNDVLILSLLIILIRANRLLLVISYENAIALISELLKNRKKYPEGVGVS